jgi:hypothetical protein
VHVAGTVQVRLRQNNKVSVIQFLLQLIATRACAEARSQAADRASEKTSDSASLRESEDKRTNFRCNPTYGYVHIVGGCNVI